jgi:hypothetical protein
VAAGKTVNVAGAGYVTTQAWLKLYVYLRGLVESELYCDRLGNLYAEIGKTPKVITGVYPSDVTDELEEFGSGPYVEEFVSRGPQTLCVFCLFPRNWKTYIKMYSEGQSTEL